MDLTNIIIISLIIGAIMPLVAKAPLAMAMKKQGGGEMAGYDNKHPRQQQSQLTGFGGRCLAAHENSFEAMIFFAPAALLVIATNQITQLAAIMSIVWVVSRILYLVCYWANKDMLRSSVWAVAMFANFYLYISCLG